jgi:hypothetical protein
VSDEWSPESQLRKQAAVEVELSGAARVDRQLADATEEPPPNWRKIAGLAALGGVGIGIIASIILISATNGDDNADPLSATTLDPADVSVLITAPPTLTPTLAPTRPATTVTLAPPTTSPPRTTPPTTPPPEPTGPPPPPIVVEPVLAPVFSQAESLVDPADFDLEAAVANLSVDRATRTRIAADDLNVDPFFISIVHDPLNNRDDIVLGSADASGFATRLVIDHDRQFGYVHSAGDLSWTGMPGDELLDGTNASDFAAFFESFRIGPLTPESLSAASNVIPSEILTVDGTTIVREFTVTIPRAELIGVAIAGFFGGSIEPEAAAGDAVFQVYVSADDEVVVTTTSSLLDFEESLLIHRYEVLDPAIAVLLPDPASVQLS